MRVTAGRCRRGEVPPKKTEDVKSKMAQDFFILHRLRSSAAARSVPGSVTQLWP